MPTPTNHLPNESEFFAGNDDAENSPATDRDATLNRQLKRTTMLPTPRRRNLPDLARVEADLRQLELRNVSMDQITAVCDRYIKARERIYIDGFQVEKGAPTVRGVPAVVAFGIQSILLGCIALRDPEWREAMRVHGNYYETDEDVGEPCSEPTETDEDAADDFA